MDEDTVHFEPHFQTKTTQFSFLFLPFDLQHIILQKLDNLTLFAFSCSSKSAASLRQACPGFWKNTRKDLLKMALLDNNTAMAVYLLPKNHWMLSRCMALTKYFWKYCGYGSWEKNAVSNQTRTSMMRYIFASIKFRFPLLICIMRMALNLFVRDCHVLVAIDQLFDWTTRGYKKPSKAHCRLIVNSLVRDCRTVCLERVLSHYKPGELSRDFLDGAMRLAASASAVPECARLLLPYY
jgi:hypothetical protein